MVNVNLIQKKATDMGLSIAALERRADLYNGAIHIMEGKNPTIETLKKIADVFGCTVDDLLVKEEG